MHSCDLEIKTDEQAPLPDALDQLVHRVEAGLKVAGDLIFNCQMVSNHIHATVTDLMDPSIGVGRSSCENSSANHPNRRGRTTTGMVAACLISTVASCDVTTTLQDEDDTSNVTSHYDSVDGSYEEEAYLRGEYKIILQLVGVLSYGKIAKRITDKAIDAMADVQNLRKAIFE